MMKILVRLNTHIFLAAFIFCCSASVRASEDSSIAHDFTLIDRFPLHDSSRDGPWRVSVQEPDKPGNKLEVKAMRQSLMSTQIAMGDLVIPNDFSLLPVLSGKGIFYSVGTQNHLFRNFLLIEEKNNFRQQVAATSFRTGLPVGNSDITVSAVSGSAGPELLKSNAAASSNAILAKGRYIRPSLKLEAEGGLVFSSPLNSEASSDDKAYRLAGETEILGFIYKGTYQYAGPLFSFLSKTGLQPDSIRRDLRITRDSVIGKMSLLFSDWESNVERNPAYYGSYRNSTELEYTPKKFLSQVSSILLFRTGENGSMPPGGGRVPYSLFDAAGGTIGIKEGVLDLKINAMQTWVHDYSTREELSRETLLQLTQQMLFQEIEIQPSFSVQKNVNAPSNARSKAYAVDLGLRKKLDYMTHLDFTCGYAGREEDQLSSADTYHGKLALKLLPANLPFGFLRSNISLTAEHTCERYFSTSSERNYSLFLTLDLS